MNDNVSDPRTMSDGYVMDFLRALYPEHAELVAASFDEEEVLREATRALRSLAKMREALEKIDLWCGCHLSPGSHGDSCPSVIARRALEESE